MSVRDPRLAEQIASLQQLSGVVAAMRGIAATRAQQSRRQLEGVRAYAQIVADSISQALGLLPPSWSEAPPPAGLPRACVLFCSEQGFVGTFNDVVCDAAEPHLAGGGQPFLVGSRGEHLLQARGHEPVWSTPMIAQPGSALTLAERIGGALVDALAAGRIGGAELIYATVDGARIDVVQHSLLPVESEHFPRSGSPPPLTYVPAPTLFRRLTEEYLRAEIAAAALESHVAENQARTQAMAAAQDNIGNRLDQLHAEQRIARQDAITDELIELAVGVL